MGVFRGLVEGAQARGHAFTCRGAEKKQARGGRQLALSGDGEVSQGLLKGNGGVGGGCVRVILMPVCSQK